MSETQTPTPTETPEPAPPEYKPQHVLASEEQQQPPPQEAQPAAESEDAAEPKPEEKPAADSAEEQRKAERRREAARIGWLTKQKYEEKARADALEARLRALEQPPNGEQRPLTQEQFDQLVEQRAAQKVAQQQHNQRFSAWDSQGVKDYGEEPFRAACKTVADMASDEQRTMLASMVPDIEGGQKAIMELADNPEEAERILALPPHRMALALAKLAAPEAPKPKPVSTLPPPIRPPQAARARGEPDPEKGSFDDYKRWSSKVEWNRY
jgi:hypothetical protein